MLGAIIGAAASASAPAGGPVVASHDGATFTFSGAVAGGNLDGSGRAYIVAPSGATLTATSPAETTWGGYAVHGAQKNPIQVASGPMQQGYDERVAAWQSGATEWSAALRATYPMEVSPGDVIVKVISSPDAVLTDDGSRKGLPENARVCYVLAAHPAPGVGEESFGWSPVGWPGRPTPALRYVPVDAKIAALPQYDMSGIATTPNIAFHAALAAIEKPLFPQMIGATTGSGYQVWFPRGSSGPDGRNYGADLADAAAGTPGLMLIADEATVPPATKKAIYKSLVQAGLDWFEPFRGNNRSHGANGGHYQFHHLPVALALDAIGENIGQIRTYMPGNILGQPFRWTQTMIDTKLVPHTGSGNSVIPQFRKTTVTAVSGLDVTLDKSVYSASKRIDGCYLKRVSDGAQSRITSTVELAPKDPPAPAPPNLATHTITAQPSPAFQVGDEVYVAPDQAIVAGDYDFATEASQRSFFQHQDWDTYSTSDASEYRSIAAWTSQLVAGVALGLMDSPDWDDAIGYMERANAAATPTATTDFPPIFGKSSKSDAFGTQWAQDVYATHWAAIKATRGSA